MRVESDVTLLGCYVMFLEEHSSDTLLQDVVEVSHTLLSVACTVFTRFVPQGVLLFFGQKSRIEPFK